MNDILVREYLKNLKYVREIRLRLESISEESLTIIDDLSNFIVKNKKYSYLSTFVGLTNALVEFIENYNKCGNLKESMYSLDNLKKDLSNFINELEKECDINIYFYGKDNFGFIDDNFLKIPIKKILNEAQLKAIASKRKIISNKKRYNIILLGEEVLFKNNFFDEVFYYNQIAKSIYSIVNTLYKRNYNLKYLKNSLRECDKENVDTVIVGNSYSVVGIEENLLDGNVVKLSMHSQDLYYAFKMLKTAVKNSKNIKKCIFGVSHYLLRHDLSKGKSTYSENMIRNIYYPLFKDVHNSNLNNFNNLEVLNDLDIDFLIKSIFDMNKIEEYLEVQIYSNNKMYYNDTLNPRRKHINWMGFSEADREIIGKDRAELHNKLLKYEDTKKEYTKLLYEFFDFLKEYNIELIVVVFPTTKYYSENIDIEFKTEFKSILSILNEKSIKLIDLRKYNDEFNNLDFWDSDHLNETGAIKATNYIKFELDKKKRED